MIYRNVSSYDLTIPNVGIVAAGETIESSEELSNGNLELIEGEKATPAAPVAPATLVPAPATSVAPTAPAVAPILAAAPVAPVAPQVSTEENK